MLKPEEILALSTIVQAQAKEAELANQLAISQGNVAPNGYFYSAEWDILNAYVQWMRDAKDLYEEREEQYAGLSLIEFISKMRPQGA